jgi:hypothetical protein
MKRDGGVGGWQGPGAALLVRRGAAFVTQALGSPRACGFTAREDDAKQSPAREGVVVRSAVLISGC